MDSSVEQGLYDEALKIANTKDLEAAKKFIVNRFGEDVTLSTVKCEKCGEILAFCPHMLAVTLTGGDKLVNLNVYRHILEYPTHGEHIYGYSHNTKLPIGSTLLYGVSKLPEAVKLVLTPMTLIMPKHKTGGIVEAAKHHRLTLDEALRSRISHLENILE